MACFACLACFALLRFASNLLCCALISFALCGFALRCLIRFGLHCFLLCLICFALLCLLCLAWLALLCFACFLLLCSPVLDYFNKSPFGSWKEAGLRNNTIVHQHLRRPFRINMAFKKHRLLHKMQNNKPANHQNRKPPNHQTTLALTKTASRQQLRQIARQ